VSLLSERCAAVVEEMKDGAAWLLSFSTPMSFWTLTVSTTAA